MKIYYDIRCINKLLSRYEDDKIEAAYLTSQLVAG